MKWLPFLADFECFGGLLIELEMIRTGEDLRARHTHFTYRVAKRSCFSMVYLDLCSACILDLSPILLWQHIALPEAIQAGDSPVSAIYTSSSSLELPLQENLGPEDACAVVRGTGHLGKNSEGSKHCLPAECSSSPSQWTLGQPREHIVKVSTSWKKHSRKWAFEVREAMWAFTGFFLSYLS